MSHRFTRHYTKAQSRESKLTTLKELVSPLSRLAQAHPLLVENHSPQFRIRGEWFSLPRYVFLDPSGDSDPIKIGVFGSIHGDEPAGAHAIVEMISQLCRQPSLARGYQIVFYPVCNPSGFEDGTRKSRSGVDLNREFWSDSDHPEVYYIEEELTSTKFHGLISLHADDTSSGVYGYVKGATLTEALIKPALKAAAAALPLNLDAMIDGFSASQSIIRDCYKGVLSAPPTVHPKPFEIIFETPALVSIEKQTNALTLALFSVLDEYRSLIATAQNL